MDAVKKVCILGGTHGNEMSGIFLLKKWQNNLKLIQRSTVESKVLLSNPEAVKLNRRYRDCDLNRCFTTENLAAKLTEDSPYEVHRAQEIKSLMSSGGEIGCCDVIIDLHNTTANMKLCLIHKTVDSFSLQALKYVSSKFPKDMCHNLLSSSVTKSTISICSCGIGIEVGPQPQGVLRSDIFQLQEVAVSHCLDFFEAFNEGTEFPETTIETHKVRGHIPFPRDAEGEINAMIHPSLQDQDWSPLKLNDPVFILVNGTALTLGDVNKFNIKEGEEVYSCFVNEAAYYEKDIAFFVIEKCQMKVSAIKRN